MFPDRRTQPRCGRSIAHDDGRTKPSQSPPGRNGALPQLRTRSMAATGWSPWRDAQATCARVARMTATPRRSRPNPLPGWWSKQWSAPRWKATTPGGWSKPSATTPGNGAKSTHRPGSMRPSRRWTCTILFRVAPHPSEYMPEPDPETRRLLELDPGRIHRTAAPAQPVLGRHGRHRPHRDVRLRSRNLPAANQHPSHQGHHRNRRGRDPGRARGLPPSATGSPCRHRAAPKGSSRKWWTCPVEGPTRLEISTFNPYSTFSAGREKPGSATSALLTHTTRQKAVSSSSALEPDTTRDRKSLTLASSRVQWVLLSSQPLHQPEFGGRPRLDGVVRQLTCDDNPLECPVQLHRLDGPVLDQRPENRLADETQQLGTVISRRAAGSTGVTSLANTHFALRPRTEDWAARRPSFKESATIEYSDTKTETISEAPARTAGS